jgi:putative addiction module component (TIGR02574 family)
MESVMGVKDAVKALLERLPDDCNLDDVIDRLYELQLLESNESHTPPLTQAQRTELDRRLDRLMQDPGRTIPWVDVRRELEREE